MMHNDNTFYADRFSLNKVKMRQEMKIDSIKLPRKGSKVIAGGDCDCELDNFHRIVSMDENTNDQ